MNHEDAGWRRCAELANRRKIIISRALRVGVRTTLLVALASMALAFAGPSSTQAGDARPAFLEGVGAQGVVDLVVAGRGGVPASGVGAVALNVTVTNASAASFLTVWPTGAVMPVASNLNFVAGQTVPNMVIAKVGAGGKVSLFNSQGSVDVIVDVLGWFPVGESFTGLTPSRLLDTRESSRVGAQGVVDLVVAGRGGVPASGVGAVALNVTVTNASAASFLTVWPTGAVMPVASNLNFVAGQTVPNMVIAKVGAGGKVSLFNSQGSVDVIVDVLGWFPVGESFTGLTPSRLLDTRESSRVGAQGVVDLVVAGRGGVPASGVGAVALNVTVTNASAASFLTVWPTGAVMPVASNLNFVAGQTVPNMVIAKVGAGGKVSLFNSQGSVDVIVDVLGWFPVGESFTGLTPSRLLDTRESSPTPLPEPTPAPEPKQSYAPGTWEGLPAGRYVMEGAQENCYWDRWGEAGPLLVQLGVSYQFHAGRTVVDLGGHETFSFTDECGPMTLLPATATPATTITAGTHVVNHHILPGEYRIVIGDGETGCGWSALSSFSGGPAALIDGMYFSDPGEFFVTIFGSDVGFETDCAATWTRVG